MLDVLVLNGAAGGSKNTVEFTQSLCGDGNYTSREDKEMRGKVLTGNDKKRRYNIGCYSGRK